MPFNVECTTMPELKQLMKEHDVSCEELALQSGVCFSTILNARKGKLITMLTRDLIMETLGTRELRKKYKRI